MEESRMQLYLVQHGCIGLLYVQWQIQQKALEHQNWLRETGRQDILFLNKKQAQSQSCGLSPLFMNVLVGISDSV